MDELLKVIHINVSDQVHGSGSMARILHERLPEAGIQSTLFIDIKTDQLADSYGLRHPEENWQQTLLQKGRQENLLEFYAPQLLAVLQHPRFSEADLVHIHATGEYFAYTLLPLLGAKPIVWTLYDSRPYTGGCRHSAHCQKWRDEECQNCPIDQRQQNRSVHTRLYQLKKEMYGVTKLTAVCTSHWQEAQVQESLLQGQTIRRISPAIDTQVFHPGDRKWFRRELGLPETGFLFVFLCREGLDESGAVYLRDALQKVQAQYTNISLLTLGSPAASTYFKDLTITVRSIGGDYSAATLAHYLRAADVLVYLNVLDSVFLPVLQAAACGTPALVFDLAAASELVTHQQTGYLVATRDSKALADGLIYFLDNESGTRELGQQAAAAIPGSHDSRTIIGEYEKLYRALVPETPEILSVAEAGITGLVQAAEQTADQVWQKNHSWQEIWKELDNQEIKLKDHLRVKNVFMDAYFRRCLTFLDVERDKETIWELANRWMKQRQPDARCGGLPAEDRKLQAAFCNDCRELLVKYFLCTPLEKFVTLKAEYHECMVKFWRWTFLNCLSSLNLETEAKIPDEAMMNHEQGKSGYPMFFIQSMFIPHPESDHQIVVSRLMQVRLPFSFKLIILLWLTSVPLYSGNEANRKVAAKHIEDFCRFGADKLIGKVPDGIVGLCLEHFTSSLWRLSYLGNNHLAALSAYGDFIRQWMLYKFPDMEKKRKFRTRKPGDRLRIGYLSTNFRTQAVSFYMANRILLHDKEKFEVYTYVLKRFEDDMTEKIRQASDKVFEYTDFKALEPIMQDIIDSELDILIYADIGMDPFTYQLGSVRLAPIQAVLVGHGVSTGLEKIDYYISGDFEPKNAQQHYREKVIRLPNLGAAQLPPLVASNELTRKTIRVPDDAVLFMSCANGIKYYRDRDKLFVAILQQAPEAWIVLKPFQNPLMIDHHLNDRLMEAARQGGVADRLVVLPPLEKPSDLWGMLTLADVQLDTYPYGGWTTNMEALYAGLPIVTQEGDMARSRWGAAMLRALGINEGIAHNEKKYVEWAVKFAKNKELRQSLQDRIKEKVKTVLFNGEQAQPIYENMLSNLRVKSRK